MSPSSIGRNDPCSCGSGKKFKKCCLPKQEADPELLRRRIRQIDEELNVKLFRHALSLYDVYGMEEAWEDYWLGTRKYDELDHDDPENQAFQPWYIYSWVPAKDSLISKSFRLSIPIAKDFLRQKENHLTPSEHRFLTATLNQPFSFHEVLKNHPDYGFLLKDILTEEEHYVLEKSCSRLAHPGDILYARIVAIDSICLMVGCGATPLLPIQKIEILDLKKWILGQIFKIGKFELKKFEVEIREVYILIRNSLHNKPLPKLYNTDKEELCLHTLHYQISSVEKSLHALADLMIGSTIEEILNNAEYDENGNLQQAHLVWLKQGNAKHTNWENTILGNITVKPSKMEVTVNSRERAKRIKQEIKKRLGKEAILKNTVLQSTESPLKQAKENPRAEKERDFEQEELLKKYPELQQRLEDFFANHWKNWLNEKIPTLDGLTPKQAAQDKFHRQKLAALLQQFEKDNQEFSPSRSPVPLQFLRKELGIEEG